MSDNNNKKNTEDNKNEEINKIFNELKENNNLSEKELNELKTSLEKIISRDENIGSLFVRLIKRIITLLLSVFIISTAVLGLLIHSVSLENIYNIPLVSLGISILFTIFKITPFLNKKVYIYVIPYIAVIALGWLFNNKLQVFDFDIVWLVYIFLVEFLFSIYILCKIKRKYSFLRR